MKKSAVKNLVLTLCFTFVFEPVFLFSQDKNKASSFRKSGNGIYVIAHRGAHNGIPENSLPAYRKAIDLGCDFIEIDARTTADGRFVSVHNPDIDSYAEGKTGFVRNMSLEQLREIDLGEKYGNQWKNTRIPTIEEILELCHGKIGIYIDLKDASIPELMKIIRKYDMEKDIVWYIPYHYFVEMDNIDETFGNSFPMPDPQNENNLDSLLEKFKIAVIATDMGELSENFVKKAHKAGVKVFVDENEGSAEEWAKIIKWNTDGIQTDKPGELIKYLNR